MEMEIFLIYDDAREAFISNMACGDRVTANKWCDFLTEKRGTLFIPVRFVNGKQVTSI